MPVMCVLSSPACEDLCVEILSLVSLSVVVTCVPYCRKKQK